MPYFGLHCLPKYPFTNLQYLKDQAPPQPQSVSCLTAVQHPSNFLHDPPPPVAIAGESVLVSSTQIVAIVVCRGGGGCVWSKFSCFSVGAFRLCYRQYHSMLFSHFHTNKTLTLKQNKQTNKNTHVFAYVILSRKGRIIRFH